MALILKVLCLIVVFLAISDAYKILFLCPLPVKSHFLWLSSFVHKLLDRGHQVTVLTSIRSGKRHRNYTETHVDPPFEIPQYFPVKDIFNSRYGSDFQNLFLYWRIGLMTTEHALATQNVQRLIEREDHFDLVIAEQFYQEAFLMFAHKFKAPIVTIGTLSHTNHIDSLFGHFTPISFVPHNILHYTDDMNFRQRCWNTIISVVEMVLRKFYYMPSQNRLAQLYFSNLQRKSGPLPDVQALERNISVMLINHHITTSPPRPLMPGQINVAGAHIRRPVPIPDDIKEFLDGATHGAIVFSLGSYINSKDMPRGKLKIFGNVFKHLKQRVLMKYEDEMIPSVTENIKLVKWLPQSDVLAHKNVVLFITHGGVFGTQEAIYRGVPMLIIPFYGDQHTNALKAEKAGYALTLSFAELSTMRLKEKMNALLSDTAFRERAKYASELFHDNPIAPMDEAMFWIEYTARHRGAPHLRTKAVTMPWYKYLLLDVLIFFSVCAAAIGWMLSKLVKLCITYRAVIFRPTIRRGKAKSKNS